MIIGTSYPNYCRWCSFDESTDGQQDRRGRVDGDGQRVSGASVDATRPAIRQIVGLPSGQRSATRDQDALGGPSPAVGGGQTADAARTADDGRRTDGIIGTVDGRCAATGRRRCGVPGWLMLRSTAAAR